MSTEEVNNQRTHPETQQSPPSEGESAPGSPDEGFSLPPSGVEEFDALIRTLKVPKNIDPVLLDLWLKREKEFYLQRKRQTQKESDKTSRSLAFVFSGFLAIVVMIVVILLGLLNGEVSSFLLHKTFWAMVCFAALGFFIGHFTEKSVCESAREMIKEVVQRSDHPLAPTAPPEPGPPAS